MRGGFFITHSKLIASRFFSYSWSLQKFHHLAGFSSTNQYFVLKGQSTYPQLSWSIQENNCGA